MMLTGFWIAFGATLGFASAVVITGIVVTVINGLREGWNKAKKDDEKT